MISAPGRAMIALLIAISLTFAPLTAARAKHAQAPGAGAATSHAQHCHEAKQHHETPAGHDCCDHAGKSKCPDQGCGCPLKCGAQTLAVFSMPAPFKLSGSEEFEASNTAQPPGLNLNPQGPPPRA